METAEGPEGQGWLVMMAPPPWSFGVQTLEPVSSRYPNLGQRHLEGLHISLKAQGTHPSTPTLQTLGPEDFSCVLIRSLVRTHYGGLLLVWDCCWWPTQQSVRLLQPEWMISRSVELSSHRVGAS